MRNLLLGSLLMALASPQAFADPSATPDAQKMASDDCARARKDGRRCRILDMGTERIDGDRPAESYVMQTLIKFGRAESLIHIRWHFIPEILRTAEDLD